ncbi:MAG: hypothetical protein KAU46_08540 [Candidatus Aminicenantes bacterium]|nr:hypothetical protein [Candidatus Aminicenantes bacterium]
MFGIITLISLFGLTSALVFHHYRRIQATSNKKSAGFKITDYISWLASRIFRQISGLSKNPLKKRYPKLVQKVFLLRYPAVEKWSIISLSLSFIFLAVSGFIYALFFTQSLHGYLLLFHVILGGIFAICLPLVVVLQAPVFSFWSEEAGFSNKIPGGRKRTGSVTLIQKILFWLFVISGFLLILTALTSMLPAFSLKDQLVMVDIHRYGALAALLSAIAFAYFTSVEDGK